LKTGLDDFIHRALASGMSVQAPVTYSVDADGVGWIIS
jgi:hypothetical protein